MGFFDSVYGAIREQSERRWWSVPDLAVVRQKELGCTTHAFVVLGAHAISGPTTAHWGAIYMRLTSAQMPRIWSRPFALGWQRFIRTKHRKHQIY